MVNLLAVFGLAPLTGVPLPFVSYGNASMLVMLAASRPPAQRRARRERRVGRRAVEPRWKTEHRRRRPRRRASARGADEELNQRCQGSS